MKLGPLPPWTRKGPVLVLVPLLVAVAVAYPLLQGVGQKRKTRDQRLAELVDTNTRVRAEHEELKKRYQELESDRDNVLKQTKVLLAEKSQWSGAQEEIEELRKANQALVDQKDRLHQSGQKAKVQLDKLASVFDRVKTAYQELQSAHRKLEAENTELRQTLTKTVEHSPQYKELDKAFRDLRGESESQKQTISVLDDKLKKALERIQRIQDRDTKFSKQIEALKTELKAASSARDSLTHVNADLNKAVDEGPRKFKDMAEENKRLRKETADMHYNMGVFFSQNNLFERAVKELERALEFDNASLRVHYNLGYLYSEKLGDHAKAMWHFQRFLELDPHGRESESIRAYLLSRQAYGDEPAAGAAAKGSKPPRA